MAINSNSLTQNAKDGWSWRFGIFSSQFSQWGDKLIVELEVQGVNHNIRRLEEDSNKELLIHNIMKKLKTASNAQLVAAIAAVGAVVVPEPGV